MPDPDDLTQLLERLDAAYAAASATSNVLTCELFVTDAYEAYPTLAAHLRQLAGEVERLREANARLAKRVDELEDDLAREIVDSLRLRGMLADIGEGLP